MPNSYPKPGPVEPAPVPSCVVICGKGRIATGALSFAVHYAAAHRLPFRIVASPNGDDSGHDTWQPSLIRSAKALGVPCVGLNTVESERDLLLISLEYDRMVRVERFASRRLFNIHFSALPRYRGVFTSIWPILNGEESVGVTLHYMDPGIDTGPIVTQVTAPLPRYMSARQLYDVYMDEGLALIQQWLPRLITTLPHGVDQDGAQATSYNRRSLDIKQVEVDLSEDVGDVCSFVRAFYFPEYQVPTVGGRAIRACAVVPGATAECPGTPLHQTEYSTSFAVGRGGIVEVTWA